MSLLTFFWSRAEKMVHVRQADADNNVDHPVGFDKLGTHTITADTQHTDIFQAIHSLLARFGGDHVNTKVVFAGPQGNSAPMTVAEGVSGNVEIKSAEVVNPEVLKEPESVNEEDKQAVETEQQNLQDISNDAEKAASLDAEKTEVTV